MHQTQWSPERPLPPPVSLTSQSHHEKPPDFVKWVVRVAFYPEAVEAAISVLSSWVQQGSMAILVF